MQQQMIEHSGSWNRKEQSYQVEVSESGESLFDRANAQSTLRIIGTGTKGG